jgi:hypothetical protein
MGPGNWVEITLTNDNALHCKTKSFLVGIMSFTNNAGRARHSVRAATCEPAHLAGRGLPALPVLPLLFDKGIIPILVILDLTFPPDFHSLPYPDEGAGWFKAPVRLIS